jgi:hypothetical protein
MFGGCEVMIIHPGVLGKAESLSGALKCSRNRQLVGACRKLFRPMWELRELTSGYGLGFQKTEIYPWLG